MTEIIAAASGFDAYLVGGALRNLILGLGVGKDYDVCVKNEADKFAKTLAKRLLASVFLMDEENRVWRVVGKSQGLTVDISLMRGECIEADLGKRDFTVNALAFRLKDIGKAGSRAIDPFNGIKDAKGKILRLVSGIALDEDPLRVIRAIRLSIECGLRMDDLTERLVKEKMPLLGRVPVERVREETVRIFSNRGSEGAVRRLFELDATEFIFPELKGWKVTPRPTPLGVGAPKGGLGGVKEFSGYDILSHSLRTLREAEVALDEAGIIDGRPGLAQYLRDDMGGVKRATAFKLAAFLHDAGKPSAMISEGEELSFIGHDVSGEALVKKILRRLKFGRKVIKTLSSAARNHHRVFVLSRLKRPSKRTKAHFFNAVGGDAGPVVLLTALCDARATRGSEDKAVYECVSNMLDFYFDIYTKKKTKPLLSGEEVMRIFDVKEGPEIGKIMKEMDELVSSGEVRTRHRAIEIIKKGREKKAKE
ncbi:MAG: HD domain-containing protein [Deltaproteobacteria bacterium]